MEREIQDYMHQEVYKRCHSVVEKMQVIWREKNNLIADDTIVIFIIWSPN